MAMFLPFATLHLGLHRSKIGTAERFFQSFRISHVPSFEPAYVITISSGGHVWDSISSIDYANLRASLNTVDTSVNLVFITTLLLLVDFFSCNKCSLNTLIHI